MLKIGSVEPSEFDAATNSGASLPSLHSPFFASDRERTIKAAVTAEGLSLRKLMLVNAGATKAP
jgi:hippurate hydrolase